MSKENVILVDIKKDIEIKINDVIYETDSAYKGFAFMVAVNDYGVDQVLAQDIAELCFELYLDLEKINEYALIYAVLEHHDSLPNDYNDIKEFIIDKGFEYNLF